MLIDCVPNIEMVREEERPDPNRWVRSKRTIAHVRYQIFERKDMDCRQMS